VFLCRVLPIGGACGTQKLTDAITSNLRRASLQSLSRCERQEQTDQRAGLHLLHREVLRAAELDISTVVHVQHLRESISDKL